MFQYFHCQKEDIIHLDGVKFSWTTLHHLSIIHTNVMARKTQRDKQTDRHRDRQRDRQTQKHATQKHIQHASSQNRFQLKVIIAN